MTPRRGSLLGFLALVVIAAGCAQGTDGSEIDQPPTPPEEEAPDTPRPPEEETDAPPTQDTGVEAVDEGVDTKPPAPPPAGGAVDPPLGKSSGGSGGGPTESAVRTTPSGVTYYVVAPASSGPQPLLIVFSGVEGGATMASNLRTLRSYTGTASFIFAVLDGKTYYTSGAPGAAVLDEIRKTYDIDNDRTYLLGESAGTVSALQLGFQLRQSYFAAYWANDVNASGKPMKNASALGFAPYGNAGPGGDFTDAKIIVDAMKAAGYRTPPPAPYDGPGAGTHGSSEQFIAALQWFPGKSRK